MLQSVSTVQHQSTVLGSAQDFSGESLNLQCYRIIALCGLISLEKETIASIELPRLPRFHCITPAYLLHTVLHWQNWGDRVIQDRAGWIPVDIPDCHAAGLISLRTSENRPNPATRNCKKSQQEKGGKREREGHGGTGRKCKKGPPLPHYTTVPYTYSTYSTLHLPTLPYLTLLDQGRKAKPSILHS